jgi:hypothetical protein
VVSADDRQPHRDPVLATGGDVDRPLDHVEPFDAEMADVVAGADVGNAGVLTCCPLLPPSEAGDFQFGIGLEDGARR